MARLDAASLKPSRGEAAAATGLRLVVLRGLLREDFLSHAELLQLPGYHFHTKPADVVRTLLIPSGIPICCLQPPPGTALQNVAALTFYGLAGTPHIAAVLLREQQAAIARLNPVRQSDLSELRRQLARLRGGADVPISAILTAACGSELEAAKLLHANLTGVTAGANRAASEAEAEERRYATLLLVECMHEGVLDPLQGVLDPLQVSDPPSHLTHHLTPHPCTDAGYAQDARPRSPHAACGEGQRSQLAGPV